jgi:hypothetical protein
MTPTTERTILESRIEYFLDYTKGVQKASTPEGANAAAVVAEGALWLLAGMGSEEAKRKVEEV